MTAPHSVSASASDPAVPPGGLLVFENGKEVFRLPPGRNQPTQNPDIKNRNQQSHAELASEEQGRGLQSASSLETDKVVELSPKVAEGSLLDRVEPEYPEDARQTTNSGGGCARRTDRQGWRGSGCSGGKRTAAISAGCDRSREPLALQTSQRKRTFRRDADKNYAQLQIAVATEKRWVEQIFRFRFFRIGTGSGPSDFEETVAICPCLRLPGGSGVRGTLIPRA